MIAVIFEITPNEGRTHDYFDAAAALKDEVEAIDGFISVERFESLSTPGKYLSLSLWRDEKAVKAWRENVNHQAAQAKGKGEIFANYRIRVTEVVRQYSFGADHRTEVRAEGTGIGPGRTANVGSDTRSPTAVECR